MGEVVQLALARRRRNVSLSPWWKPVGRRTRRPQSRSHPNRYPSPDRERKSDKRSTRHHPDCLSPRRRGRRESPSCRSSPERAATHSTRFSEKVGPMEPKMTRLPLAVASIVLGLIFAGPKAEAQSRQKGPANSQSCSSLNKECQRAAPRRSQKQKRRQRTRKKGLDFWEKQRQNQRG